MNISKRIWTLLLCLCMLAFFTLLPAYAATSNSQANATMTVSKTDVNVGDTVTVILSNKAISVEGFGIYLEFNKACLECTSITGADGDEYMGLYKTSGKAPWVDANLSDSVEDTNKDGVFSFGVVPGLDTQYKEGVFATLTFTAKAAGTVEIVLNEDTAGVNKFKGVASTETVMITAPVINVTGVTLDKATADINIGGTTTLVATVAPANATNKKVTFTSSDPTVASVDPVSGVVTGLKEGNVTITATTEDGGKTATCAVNVTCAHNFNKKDETNATAVKEAGNCNKATVYYYFCSVCSVRGGDTNTYEGEKVADAHKKGELQKDADYHWYVCDNGCGNPIEKAAHADSTKQVATEAYLKNPEATCTQKLEYYYACTVCESKVTAKEAWVSDTFGTVHTYDTHNDAQPEVHKKDEELKASVAAHYICACGKYFTETKVETTLAELTGEKPQHDDIGGYNHNTDKHWKTCKVCGLEHIAQAEDHAFANAEDMICDTCGYDRSCTHPEGLKFVEAVAPTCTENGSKAYWQCEKCSAKFAENSTSSTKLGDVTDPKLGHAPDDTYTTDEVSHWKVCTRENCGIVLEDTKAKHDGEATCVAKAKCSVCEKEYGEINKDNHKPGALEHDAEYHWNKCDNLCGEKLNEKKHEGGTATCENKPVCSTCNVEYGAALGHAFSTTLEAKGAEGHGYKCTNGCGEYKDFADHDNTGEICEDCGYVYHTCGADTVTFVPAVPGTCVKKGYAAYYKCTDAKCGKLYHDAAATSIINSLTEIESYGAHNTSFIPAVPATCTTNGATESMTCWTCGMKFMTSTVIPATGHNFGEWTTTLEPTDFVAGSKSRTCSNCNEVETEVIPALDHEHTAVEIPAVAPTCTETGLTAGSKCSTCEAIIVAQETVPVLEHIVEHVAAKAATATEAGNVEYWYCTACEVVWLDEQRTTTATKEDVVIPATGETVIETPAEEGGESSVIITGTGIVAGTKVEVTYKPAEEFANISVTVEGKQGSILQVADITLQLDGNKVQPDGSVQVKLLINEALRALENLEVVHIAADGTVEVMNAVREGNYLVFDAKHFSNYAVVELKEEVVTEPEETTQAPEETTAAPEETTQAPEETTAAPEETTAAPEETTQAPEDITVPEETTEAPVETTEAPEETTAAPEETTSPEVPSTGDSAIFFIVALIAFSAIFAFAVALGKKRTEN